jgi:predicted RNA-binding protein
MHKKNLVKLAESKTSVLNKKKPLTKKSAVKKIKGK